MIGDIVQYAVAPGKYRAALIVGVNAQEAAAQAVVQAASALTHAQAALASGQGEATSASKARASVQKQQLAGGGVATIEDAHAVIAVIEAERVASEQSLALEADVTAAKARAKAAKAAQAACAEAFDLQVFTNGQADMSLFTDRYQPVASANAVLLYTVHRASVAHDAAGAVGTWRTMAEGAEGAEGSAS